MSCGKPKDMQKACHILESKKRKDSRISQPKISSYTSDYGPKYSPRRVPIIPKKHSVESSTAMEKATEFNQNFTPKQADVPESYAPLYRYTTPQQSMLRSSVYRDTFDVKPLPEVERWPVRSYIVCTGDPESRGRGADTEYTSSYDKYLTEDEMLAVRLAPIRQKDNLLPEQGSKMETTTTNKEAYKGVRQTPAHLIRPKHKPISEMEPFQTSTENRDSFTAKAIQPVKAYKLKDNEIMSGSFEGNSGYKDDFKPRAAQKTQSFAPAYEYRRPSAKFASETTNQSDFVTYKDVKKQPKSVMSSHDHWKEIQRMGGDNNVESTYKFTSYRPSVPQCDCTLFDEKECVHDVNNRCCPTVPHIRDVTTPNSPSFSSYNSTTSPHHQHERQVPRRILSDTLYLQVPTRPTSTRPTYTRPTSTRPTYTRPTSTRPTSTRPTSTRPSSTRPSSTRRSSTRPRTTSPTDSMPCHDRVATPFRPLSGRLTPLSKLNMECVKYLQAQTAHHPQALFDPHSNIADPPSLNFYPHRQHK